MSEESKSGTPRWILIATGIVGLIAAILVAGTKYYEFHKSRAEAAKVMSEKQNPNSEPTPDEKGVADKKSVVSSFKEKSIWEGFTDEPIGLKTRIEVDSIANGKFKGMATTHQAGVEWHSVRIQGTISDDNVLEFKTRREDLITGNKFTPTYFKGVIRGNQLIGRWTAEGGPSASFTLTCK
jgi:hypothetical protein